MSKLMDICGLANYDKDTRIYDQDKSVYGSVLLDETSAYFEGIVRTYDEKNAYLVFGTFDEENGLHMYSFNKATKELQETIKGGSITKIRGTKGGDVKFAEFTTPEMKLIIQDGDLYRDVTTGEMSVLQTAVNVLKQECNMVDKNKQKTIK